MYVAIHMYQWYTDCTSAAYSKLADRGVGARDSAPQHRQKWHLVSMQAECGLAAAAVGSSRCVQLCRAVALMT